MNPRSDVTLTHVALTPFMLMCLLSIDCNLLPRIAKIFERSSRDRRKLQEYRRIVGVWNVNDKEFNFNRILFK